MTPQMLASDVAISALYGMTIYWWVWWLCRRLVRWDRVADAMTRPNQRHGTIDGLRGVLAMCVLIHHSSAAYGYFTTGTWSYGANPLLNHFGQSSVALFFMITAFLFTSKVVHRKVDWMRLYTSRVFRLFPLYAVVVSAAFLVVLFKDGFVLRVPPVRFALDYVQWLMFVVAGRPDINGMKDSELIIAGVNWTLRYEVTFYVMVVPVIFLVSKVLDASRLALLCLALGLLLVDLEVNHFVYLHPCFLQFLVGMLTAILHRSRVAMSVFRHWSYHVIGSLSLVALMRSTSDSQSTILLFFVFSSVLGGASLFGLLETRAAIWLGDISYGVYLLHGLVLYASLSILQRMQVIDVIGLWQYWLVVIAASGVVVLMSSVSYVVLEKPMMRRCGHRGGIGNTGDPPS